MLFPKGRPTTPCPTHHGAPGQQRPAPQVRPLVSSQHLQWSGATERGTGEAGGQGGRAQLPDQAMYVNVVI